mgnify:FL=1
MKQFLLAVVAAAGIAACGSDSSLPVATGKGNVRAINGLPTSPEIDFRIEERGLGSLTYKTASTPSNWDDLDYLFNFDYRPPGVLVDPVRFATEALTVKVDTVHTFLLWGDFSAPTITLWEWPERVFSDSDTVFELRVINSAVALGEIDVYFALDGVTPVLGEQVATLEPGEISDPMDYEGDTYITFVTPAGDPNTILYESPPAGIVARQSQLLTVFEGDANDTAPVTARFFNNIGSSVSLPDVRFLPTRRFIHGTMNLETADIYDDEAVTNRIYAGLAFGDATNDIEVAAGDVPITLTAENNPGAILFEQTYPVSSGSRVNTYMFWAEDALRSSALAVDRRPVETEARITWFQSSDNQQLVDLYLVDRGETIDEALPRQVSLLRGFLAPPLRTVAGSYDIYITVAGEKTILDGPLPIDLALGDVVEAILLDRVDPALAEFRIIPPP